MAEALPTATASRRKGLPAATVTAPFTTGVACGSFRYPTDGLEALEAVLPERQEVDRQVHPIGDSIHQSVSRSVHLPSKVRGAPDVHVFVQLKLHLSGPRGLAERYGTFSAP